MWKDNNILLIMVILYCLFTLSRALCLRICLFFILLLKSLLILNCQVSYVLTGQNSFNLNNRSLILCVALRDSHKSFLFSHCLLKLLLICHTDVIPFVQLCSKRDLFLAYSTVCLCFSCLY